MDSFKVTEMSIGKLQGSSPSECRIYALVLFDISNTKKRGRVVKILQSYCNRIQYSVFEAYLKRGQIKKMLKELKTISRNEKLSSPNDQIRVYQVSGNCDLTVFGQCDNYLPENDVFI